MVILVFLLGSSVRAVNGALIAGILASLVILCGAAFCWRRGWLGGGDVKLLAASAMLVPPTLVVRLLLDVAVAGGILAIVHLVLGWLRRSFPLCHDHAGYSDGCAERNTIAFGAVNRCPMPLLLPPEQSSSSC